MPSLQKNSSFGLDTKCASLQCFSDISTFKSIYKTDTPCYIIGEGSNSIFVEDFDGTVLVNRIEGISHYESEDHHCVRVGAGENWHQFVSFCLQNNWYGLENLALIPGAVGACPIQNIGAYGVEVGRFIDSVEVVSLLNGEAQILRNEECEFGYRDSVFKRQLAGKVLITHVNFKLAKNFEPEVSYGELSSLSHPSPQEIFETVIKVRKKKLPDPSEIGNAGSFFKNPIVSISLFKALNVKYENIPHFTSESNQVKIPAAWLIDKCGFKGKTYNEVRCHPSQPLVLTNIGNAKGEDVLFMARSIVTRVYEEFGIKLEPEVRLVGSKGLISL